MPSDRQDDRRALRDTVLGAGQFEDRLQFYCDVMGLAVAGISDWDTGPVQKADLLLAERVMASFGRRSVADMRKRLGALRVLVASALRARHLSGPGLRRATGEVRLDGTEETHAGFFSLEVARLSHRRFDGSMSQRLQREVLLSGDAVTVLPYDPRRDRVLLIEQMRMGPLGRGDPLPWQIEAIAGRIDPDESPEDCARREAVEEAGLALGRLEKVAEYYPSPGAMSEYVYSYVALCDLSDEVVGVFGAEEEAEDIRGFLLSHAELMAALERGELGSAPLLLSVLWLDRERPRLRGLAP